MVRQLAGFETFTVAMAPFAAYLCCPRRLLAPMPAASPLLPPRSLEGCAGPVRRGDEYIQNELADLQHRLARCAHSCRDEANEKLLSAGQPSASHIASAQGAYDSCVSLVRRSEPMRS